MQTTVSYLGVFSRRERNTKGMVAKKLYFVWEAKQGYLVQELNRAYQPLGNPVPVAKRDFARDFKQENSIHATPEVREKAQEMNHEPRESQSSLIKITGKLEGLGEFGELPQDAVTAPPAAKNDAKDAGQNEQTDSLQREMELRELFRKAMLRLKRPRERAAALEMLKTLSDVEEGIYPRHKHMFADFGVRLRQSTLLELALQCCQRVLDLAPDDDHAHFNMARILFEMDQLTESKKHLMRAIELDASEKLYHRMLQHVERVQLAAQPLTVAETALDRKDLEPISDSSARNSIKV